jgi:hypothetical protein
MEEIISSILYGKLEVEIPAGLTAKQQMEIMRMVVVNPSSYKRLRMPPDFHPWVTLLLRCSFPDQTTTFANLREG